MGKSETRLGKGLGALLGEYMEEGEAASGGERRIAVGDIRPNPFQPRSDFEAEALGDLLESIRENGLLQPLVVRPSGEEWEIVAGERRWRCLVELGWETAPAVVRELEDEQMLVLALVENLQRENLSPLEEARGYRQLMDSFALTQEEVAGRVGKDRSTVANALRLLNLPDSVMEMVADGRLSSSHARAILGLPTAEQQIAVAREVVGDGLSVRETERKVRGLKDGKGDVSDDRARSDGGGDTGGGRRGDPLVRRAEQALERTLGTGVSIELRGSDAGRIGITFHDAEEFERLVTRIGGDGAADLFDAG